MSAEQKTICVVIDTNIWIQDSSLLLKTAMGSALLYILNESDGKIGLPEIIEEELTRNTVKKGMDAVEAINKNIKAIEVIMGFRRPYQVPDKAELEATVRERLTELQDLIIPIPFTFEHAKSALRRINEKSQPNGEKNQQFKDSAIWEAILTLLSSYTVHFITNDNQFFLNRQNETGKLAPNLLDDSRKLGGVVHIYKDMASCVKVLQKDVPLLDYSNLILEIDGLINSQLRQDLLDDPQLIFVEITELVTEKSSVSAFLTENKKNLALTFELSYSCNDSGDERKDAILITRGDCLYERATESISDITINFEEIYWKNPSGEEGRRRMLYAAGTGSSKSGKLTFREPLGFMNNPNLSREERVKKLELENFLEGYTEEKRKILKIFIEIYKREGYAALKVQRSIHTHQEFTGYNPEETFGGMQHLSEAVEKLEKLLYS